MYFCKYTLSDKKKIEICATEEKKMTVVMHYVLILELEKTKTKNKQSDSNNALC